MATNLISSIGRSSYLVARGYRRMLSGGPSFVAITGSFGKTTTTELVSAVLSEKGTVSKSSLTNSPGRAALAVLRTMPWHAYCVAETSGHYPGALVPTLRFFQPDIGIVTRVASDHHSYFGNLEATAAEKGRLVENLPKSGTAILNCDDPMVWKMRERTSARVIGIGRESNATVRALEVFCQWPDRLRLRVKVGDCEVEIRSQFCGDYAVIPVLAALATAFADDIPLESAVMAIENTPPLMGRMRPYVFPDSVTLIDDSIKASVGTLPAAFDFLHSAEASRKILVLGTISDMSGDNSRKIRRFVRQALEAADIVFYAGWMPEAVQKLQQEYGAERVQAFQSVDALTGKFRTTVRPGDLVLLKGSPADGLDRIVLDRFGAKSCGRKLCGERKPCRSCPLRNPL